MPYIMGDIYTVPDEIQSMLSLRCIYGDVLFTSVIYALDVYILYIYLSYDRYIVYILYTCSHLICEYMLSFICY